jgi:hypothetical protein
MPFLGSIRCRCVLAGKNKVLELLCSGPFERPILQQLPPIGHRVTQTLVGRDLKLVLRGLILKKWGHWCLSRKEATADHQITMAELMNGHYFTAATLIRTHRWMAVDCVFKYYVVFNF